MLTADFWFGNGRRIIGYIAVCRTLYIISVTWRAFKVISAFFSLLLLCFDHWNSLWAWRRCWIDIWRIQSFIINIFSLAKKINWFNTFVFINLFGLPFPWFSVLGVCTELLFAGWVCPVNGNTLGSDVALGLVWLDSCIAEAGTEDGLDSSDGVGVRDLCTDAVGTVHVLVFVCSFVLAVSVPGSGCADGGVGVISPKPTFYRND